MADDRCLQDADATGPESFEWLSQLRFDLDPLAKDPTKGLWVKMADARFEYGFEYLGIGERLVQTPLTDRSECFSKCCSKCCPNSNFQWFVSSWRRLPAPLGNLKPEAAASAAND